MSYSSPGLKARGFLRRNKAKSLGKNTALDKENQRYQYSKRHVLSSLESDIQFERHPVTYLTELEDLLNPQQDTLRLLAISGDHTTIPLEPSIVTLLTLQSFCERLGYEYVMDLNGTYFAYNPATHELSELGTMPSDS